MLNDRHTIIVLCSTPSQEVARELGMELIRLHYAACCNIIPGVISIYQWKNELCEDQECLLVIKAIQPRYKQIEEFIRCHHPYETPECIALPITSGAADFLQWIDEQTILSP